MSMQPLPKRADLPIENTWNIDSIFENKAAWEKAFQEVEASLPGLSAFGGHLNENPEKLLSWFSQSEAVKQKLVHIYMYAVLNYSTDTTNQEYAAMNSMVSGLYARTLTALSFEEPELMNIGFETLRTWMDQEPDIASYAHYFDQLEKRSAHIRSREVEALLGGASDAFSTSSDTHGVLTNADMVFEPAFDSHGEKHELSHSSITQLLSSRDRPLRKSAYENYATAHLAYRHTMANCLSAGYKQDLFQANARRYENTLQAALAPSFLPVEVYHNVIDTFRKHLPTWHRYWEVRRKALNLEEMHVYDTRADLIDKMPMVSYQQSVDWIVEGVRILGDDYADIVKRGTNELRWVDYLPNIGKRFGAFSAGFSGTQPFIMMSFDNSLFTLSILAHELGHSMHSYLTWQNQPFIYSDYSLFVAEVASNFHQAIVRAYLLETLTARDFQIAVIEEAMANFFRYFFIMPSLAIFDLEAHQRVERGEGLTAESLTNLMAEIFQEGYGPNVVIDREHAGSVWMQFSSHLYSNYYTYQYTTGISAAQALAENILSGDETAIDNYLSFLKAGGSLYPLDALNLAGIDMTTPAPVEKTFQVLSRLIDRLEKLLLE